jgi:hypothetical protein
MWGTPTVLLLAALGGATGVSGDAPTGLIGLRSQAAARAAALRIFDLGELDWSARVTDVQMDHRVGARVTVRLYLDAERARRAASVVPASADGQHP